MELLVEGEELTVFRAGLRSWLRQNAELVPDRDSPIPRPSREWSRALHQGGYAAVTWPEQFGGRGLTAEHQVVVAEELIAANAPEHVNVVGLGMVGPTLIQHGSSHQQDYYLSGIVDASIVCCQAFSESEAGSDLAAIRTTARPDGEFFVVNGEKLWSSYAPAADVALLLAVTDPTASAKDRFSCFMLDLRTPGVTVSPIRQITGDDGFGQILLDDVVLDRANLVGPQGAGWRVAMSTLAHERGTFGLTLVLRSLHLWSQVRQLAQSSGHIGDPLIQFELAATRADLEALKITGFRTLAALAEGQQPGPETTAVKLSWSKTNQRVAELAFQILGSAAVSGTAPDTLHWQFQLLRSRANTIEGGTSQILRSILAEQVLNLPRSR